MSSLNAFAPNAAYSFMTTPPDFSGFFPQTDDENEMSNGNIFTRGLSRLSKRKKKQKSLQSSLVAEQNQPTSFYTPPIQYDRPTIFAKGMDRLRRSLRLPKRRDRSNDQQLSPQNVGGAKSDQWQPDESAVRTGNCCFNVKYLGSIEVYESRGMQVCEGALKALKAARRKPTKAVLYVSGDGLRVVDQSHNRGLLVDQTIEKVSFCAPDRTNDKGFAYICREGTSRRWMCHGFYATKESGERLSHAVGCAFAICLERKKKRDEENAIGTGSSAPSTSNRNPLDALNPNWNDVNNGESTSTAQRSNLAYQSFRKHVSIEERYLDPQSVIVNEVPVSNLADEFKKTTKPRPTSNPALFQRQGSLRAPDPPTSDQFKRNLSLRTTPNLEITPSKKQFGKCLYQEPIYEGDEDPLGLGISPPTPANGTIQNNGLDGIDLNFSAKPAPLPLPTSTLNTANGDFAQWPTNGNGKKVSSPLDDIQKQFEEIKINTSSVNQANSGVPSFMSTSTSRSKADEWLDDVLRVSMTMSPTNSANVTPSMSLNQLSLASIKAGKSGPPPTHAPPPLPTKQAVSNGHPSIYQNTVLAENRSSPSGINWNTSPSQSRLVQLPAKPIDPFDVQWSKLATEEQRSA